MPGRRRAERAAAEAAQAVLDAEPIPAAPVEGSGLTAAAARVEVVAPTTRRKKMQAPWQERGWHFYNTVGEWQSAANWMGNQLSKVRIFAAELGDDGRPTKPATDPRVLAVAAGVFGGAAGTTQAMAQLGVHLSIPGDSYIVIETEELTQKDVWTVVSTTELKARQGVLGIDRGDGWRPLDPKASVVLRVWNPHPQKREEATSMTRAALPILEELEQVGRRQSAQLDARLAGAGILLISKTIDFQVPGQQEATGVGRFSQALVQTAQQAMDDRDSPAALVPIVAAVPDEAVDKVRHLKFWEGLTAETKEAREDCVRRLSITADMNPETMLGRGSANHWGAQSISEDDVTTHVSPKAQTVVEALTEQYLRPALQAAAPDLDPTRYALWYDVSDLILRPNRVADAKDLHNAGVLAARVLVAEAGFDPDTEMPDEEEQRKRLLTQIVLARPDLITAEVMNALGLTGIAIATPAETQPALPAPEETDDSGDPGTAPDTAEDPPPSAALNGLTTARVVAVEGLISRGLERANVRLMTRGTRGRFNHVTDQRRLYLEPGLPITTADVARALEGGIPHLDEVAHHVDLPVAGLADQLDGYLRHLLTTRTEHTREATVALVEALL